MFRRQNIMPSRIPCRSVCLRPVVFRSAGACGAALCGISARSCHRCGAARGQCRRTTQPASLTKMMTLFLAFDALDKGDLALDQLVPVSRRAQNMAPSKLGLVAGTTIRVEDAFWDWLPGRPTMPRSSWLKRSAGPKNSSPK